MLAMPGAGADHRDRPLTVLHATEALGGGITSSILQLVASAHDMEHHLVYVARQEHETGADLRHHFASLSPATGLLNLSARLHQLSAELRPDVVHLHSSWAGLAGRLRPPHGPALAYSPHSYFFEQVNYPRLARIAAWAVERILASRGDLTICVSPYEEQLARGLGSASAYMPNTIAAPRDGEETLQRTRRVRDDEKLTVLTIGRIAPQKDPSFLARVVQLVKQEKPHMRWVWVGDGDGRYRKPLETEGVEITGWIPREQALDALRQADLYLHTAAWEGNPMSLLEAAAMGVPVLARSIPALTSLGYPDGLRTPDEVAAALLKRLAGRAPEHAPAVPTAAEQRFALHEAYTRALQEHSRRPQRTIRSPWRGTRQ